jgi:hypothetical protein
MGRAVVQGRQRASDLRFCAKFDAKFTAVESRFGTLDQKLSRQCVWLTGMMVTLLIAVVGALLTRQ